MKLNFPLDKLELFLDDDWLMEGENLLAARALKSVVEVEKSLWLGRFTEGVETEVQLSGGKVRSCSCECEVFGGNGICAHVAAVLMELLEKRKAKAEKIAAKPKSVAPNATTESNAPRLTIPNILKRVEPNQLIEFIADYARNDKQFALALKTRFAADISPGEIEAHYRGLIDNTLRSIKNPKGNVTPKGWLQLFTMLDELRQKAEAHYKSGELAACFEMTRITLPLVHRFMRSSDSPKVKLERRQVQFTELLRGFDGLLLSPELSEKLWDFMLIEFNQNVRFEFSARLFDALLKKTDTPHRVENLVQAIDNQLVINKSNSIIRDKLLTQKVQILQKSGKVEEASALILSSAQQPDVLLFAIENAMASEEYALAKNLSLNGLTIFQKSDATTDRLEEFLLGIAIVTFDTEGVLLYGEKRLMRTMKFEFYELLRGQKLTPKQLSKIVEKLENQPYRLEKRDTLAQIYASEQQFDKLSAFILSLQSLELLRRYGYELWRHDADKTVDLHKKIIYEYLYSHLGRPPAQRIRQILETLIQNGGWSLAENLSTQMKRDFIERQSLKEEMDDMFLDWERKASLNKP